MAEAASNELRLLPLEPGSNGVTLRWTSMPGAYYNVYYADALADWTVWRLAAARIPAAPDTNVTSWTDDSVQAQMAAARLLAVRAAEKTLSKEEVEALIEKYKATPRQDPPLPPKEPPPRVKDYLEAPDKEAFLKDLRERLAANELLRFESTAFGGTNYLNTPVGALSYTTEPGGVCAITYEALFKLWALGKPFAICAWNAGIGPTVQVTGDPLVRR